MSPLTFLPLLAAACMAAPGVLLAQQHSLLQVPVTRTIHYENRPVVTGYQTTVVKPSLAAAPLALSGIPNYVYARQIPGLEPPADSPITPPPSNSTPIAPPADNPIPITPPPTGDQPSLPGLTPPGQTTQKPGENGTMSGDQGGTTQSPYPPIPIPGAGGVVQLVNPVQLSSVAIPQTLAVQPVAVQARSLPVVRAAQAGDFGPLVTQEKVLAPVRTHTQITPQLTQIQPEITVRRIVHDVPVASPVAIQTPYIQQLSGLRTAGNIVLA